MKSRQRQGTMALAGIGAVVAGVLFAAPAPAAGSTSSVTIAGDLDSEIGCSGDWQPDCAAAHLTQRPDGLWAGTFTIPAGDYSYKAALNDSWAVSYGPHAGSGNASLHVAATGPVTFLYDDATHYLTDSVNGELLAAVGNFQKALGCAADSDATCTKTLLEDLDGDGVATVSSTALPTGTYTAQAVDFLTKAAVGAAVSFTVPKIGGGVTVTMSAPVAHPTQLAVTATPLVQAPAATFSHPTSGRTDVVANLFEWNWASVATECRTVLGPAGYEGVQVAPPEDSISKTDGPVHPWWEVYQPVDYNLTSRMGNEAQFRTMVDTCRQAGVHVYVDAVINHMTGQGNVSYGGVDDFTKYDYPGVYTDADFHHAPQDCPRADDTISDFNNYLEVTKCELVGLSDLRTESTTVRSTIAGYLNKLLGYGVSGFRVDAAKHIGQTDLTAIEAQLRPTVDGTRPYIALEVPPGGPGKLDPHAFEGQGNLLGFDFAMQIKAAFTSNVTDLSVFGEQAGLLPSDKSLAFVENHDTERNGQTLSYKDGPTNTLATQFMLAYGYGKPEVYASFTWTNSDDSPPSDAKGYVSDTDCTAAWACTDRSLGVAGLVDVHNYAAGAPVQNWYDNGVDTIAFSRGNRAFFALNNGTAARSITVQTGLVPGVYCNVAAGRFASLRGIGACSGPTVTVDGTGRATVALPAKGSVAFDAGDRVR